MLASMMQRLCYKLGMARRQGLGVKSSQPSVAVHRFMRFYGIFDVKFLKL